jgi:hypothetical protein
MDTTVKVCFWNPTNPGCQGFETWKLGFSKSRMDTLLIQVNARIDTGALAFSAATLYSTRTTNFTRLVAVLVVPGTVAGPEATMSGTKGLLVVALTWPDAWRNTTGDFETKVVCVLLLCHPSRGSMNSRPANRQKGKGLSPAWHYQSRWSETDTSFRHGSILTFQAHGISMFSKQGVVQCVVPGGMGIGGGGVDV